MSYDREDEGGKVMSKPFAVPDGSGDFCVLRGSPGGIKQRFKTGILHYHDSSDNSESRSANG